MIRSCVVAAIAAVSCLSTARPASAQTVGTYVGTTGNGSPISLIVAYDAQHRLAITGVSETYTPTCAKGVPPFQTGTRYVNDAAIAGTGRFSFTEQYQYLNQIIAGRVVENRMTGSVYTATPSIDFMVKPNRPRAAVVCYDGTRTFKAILQTAGSIPPGRPPAIYSVHQ